jgi:arylsulfatase A-like enzyme
MNARPRSGFVLIATLWLVCGCGSEKQTEPATAPALEPANAATHSSIQAEAAWRVHTRLVDSAARRGARSVPPDLRMRRALERAWESAEPDRPTATLRDDTRPVLAAPMRLKVRYLADLALPEDRKLPAPPGHVMYLPREHDWVLAPLVRDSRQRKGASLHLPGLLVRSRSGVPGAARGLVIPVPEELSAPKVDLFLRTLSVPRGGLTRYDSGPLPIPERARLEFALGILEPAREQSPVEFSVLACEAERCDSIFEERIDPRTTAEEGWQDRSVDLDPQVGRKLSLRFEARWDDESPTAFSLPVFADPRILVPAQAEPEAPRRDIILLSIDTLRADHLPTYGYGRDTAPFMRDVLAARGTVFDDMVAAATTTGPSHMSIFTSLSPTVHGVTKGHGPLAAPVPTLAMRLRDAGYETAAFTDNGSIDHERGFALGFDRFHENKSARVMQAGQVEETFARARRHLDHFEGRPRFLFLHTFQVHGPHTPPPAYADLFADEAPPRRGPSRKIKAFETARGYDREIRYLDEELRKFVEWLDSRGFFETGLLVVTSDHGEAFQEHNVSGHAGLPHEEVLHIPLFLLGASVPAGLRVSERVTHIDLMPTLLEWAGIDAPTHISGQSLLPLLSDGTPSEHVEQGRVTVSEAWGGGAGLQRPALAFKQGRHKLLRFVGVGNEVVYRYYDLEADPGEQENRYAEMSEDDDVRALRELAEGYGSAAEALRTRARLPSAGETASRQASEQPEPPPLDPEREAKLRVLGYIE